MPTAYLLLHAKGGAQLGDRRAIHTDFLPRAGEMIEVGRELKIREGDVHHALVQSVVYRLESSRLTPYITAQLGDDREWLLKSRRWMDPADSAFPVEYDHRDAAEQIDEAAPQWGSSHTRG